MFQIFSKNDLYKRQEKSYLLRKDFSFKPETRIPYQKSTTIRISSRIESDAT